jgi:hypothetical protein
MKKAPPAGLEGASNLSGNTSKSEKGAAYSGAVPSDSPSPPTDLAFVINRWPMLTQALRAQIVSLVEGGD